MPPDCLFSFYPHIAKIIIWAAKFECHGDSAMESKIITKSPIQCDKGSLQIGGHLSKIPRKILLFKILLI